MKKTNLGRLAAYCLLIAGLLFIMGCASIKEQLKAAGISADRAAVAVVCTYVDLREPIDAAKGKTTDPATKKLLEMAKPICGQHLAMASPRALEFLADLGCGYKPLMPLMPAINKALGVPLPREMAKYEKKKRRRARFLIAQGLACYTLRN